MIASPRPIVTSYEIAETSAAAEAGGELLHVGQGVVQVPVPRLGILAEREWLPGVDYASTDRWAPTWVLYSAYLLSILVGSWLVSLPWRVSGPPRRVSPFREFLGGLFAAVVFGLFATPFNYWGFVLDLDPFVICLALFLDLLVVALIALSFHTLLAAPRSASPRDR